MSNHMTKVEAEKEVFRIADRLDLTTAGNPFEAAHEMRRVAMGLDALNVKECNGVRGPDGFMKWDEQDQAKADKRRENLTAQFKALMLQTFPADIEDKVKYEFQGDPRGPSVKVYALDGQQLATFW